MLIPSSWDENFSSLTKRLYKESRNRVNRLLLHWGSFGQGEAEGPASREETFKPFKTFKLLDVFSNDLNELNYPKRFELPLLAKEIVDEIIELEHRGEVNCQ